VIVVPNPGLKPEYIYNFEAGAQKTFLNIFDFGSVAYFAILRDAMVRGDFSYNGLDSMFHDGRFKKTQALVNSGKAFIIGGSVYAKADLSKWLAMSASLNVIKGEDRVQKTPLRHAAPAFGNCSATIKLKRMKTELDFSFNGPKKISNMPPDELAKPHLYTPEGSLAWSTLNIYTSYQLSRNLSVQLDIENIFDTHYRPYSSGISAAGRNLVMALKYMF
jgi:hemoglobin/transferrin/lactoferrin receptor protein